MISLHPSYEFLRPLQSSWLAKIEKARAAREHWEEVAQECEMFYSKSAAAMWKEDYKRKFWKGVPAPRFRVTINKAFELVAIFGPHLMWENPHRNVEPKRPCDIPPDIYGDPNDPQVQQHVQQVQMQYQQLMTRDNALAEMMNKWLNYTPREMPGGGLHGHSELAIVDALIKGRGCIWTRPYVYPASGRVLTGCFYDPPENLFIDPDFDRLDQAKWIARKVVMPIHECEKKFQLPKGALKNKGTLESAWSDGERKSDPNRSMYRSSGQTQDLITYYEIFSKAGVGARLSGMEHYIKDELDEAVGDYAYLCISASVPYPLNCPSAFLSRGDEGTQGKQPMPEQVQEKFSWPIPYWTDDRWPVQVLDFYHDPSSAYPIAPLAPALGELKFLNIMIPHVMNRIWSSSRDFWAVAGPAMNHLEKHLKEGADQTIIPIPASLGRKVSEVVTVLQQPQMNMDVWRVMEAVSDLFDKRTGLSDYHYAQATTQPRSAEESANKKVAAGVRPEHMQKKVVEWQERIAASEAFCARWFVTAKDVEPLLGPHAQLWDQIVSNADPELVVREMQYNISASSIRRPNRDRDLGNFQQVMQLFAPVLQGYGASTGNYEPFNSVMRRWAELTNTNLDGAMIPPPEQPDPQEMQMQQQMQQQQMQFEMQKLQTDIQKGQLELQKIQMETQKVQVEAQAGSQMSQVEMQAMMQKVQADMQLSQSKIQAMQQKAALDSQSGQSSMQIFQQKAMLDAQLKQSGGEMDHRGRQLDMMLDGQRHGQEMQQDQDEHLLGILQDRQTHIQEMTQLKEMGKIKADQARKPKPSTNGVK